MFELTPALAARFPEEGTFEHILALEGTVYRHVKGRRTLRFEVDGCGYFLKAHKGVGWGEIFKNLVRFRLPVVGAGNEHRAIHKFQQLGVATMTVAGYGERGLSPATRQSFLITEELDHHVNLEEFCRNWPTDPPAFSLRRALTEKLADIARTLHGNGVNHRDFYLCHFLLEMPLPAMVTAPKELQIFLIDLHRVQIRPATPERWVVKDIAGLYFSALNIGLTRRDVWRFMRHYRGGSLRDTLRLDAPFWEKVRKRAVQLYRRDFRCDPVLPV